jgi:excinuclease UvrABC nuclease subunit
VGPATRKKLIKAFGSGRALKTLSEAEIAQIIGPDKARKIKEALS